MEVEKCPGSNVSNGEPEARLACEIGAGAAAKEITPRAPNAATPSPTATKIKMKIVEKDILENWTNVRLCASLSGTLMLLTLLCHSLWS